jgi:hypothetical protein
MRTMHAVGATAFAAATFGWQGRCANASPTIEIIAGSVELTLAAMRTMHAVGATAFAAMTFE